MKHFRLTHLRIVLEYVIFSGENVPPTPAGVLEGDHSVYYAREEELYPAATRLFAVIPTLKYLLMTTCGYTFHRERTLESYEHTFKWLSSKAWRVPDVHADLLPSGTGFVEIDNEEAETVIDREELHVAKAAQVRHERPESRDSVRPVPRAVHEVAGGPPVVLRGPRVRTAPRPAAMRTLPLPAAVAASIVVGRNRDNAGPNCVPVRDVALLSLRGGRRGPR